jgi:hypothetical protein
MKILIYQQNAHYKNVGGFKLGCDILNYEYLITDCDQDEKNSNT